ncbi:MAG: ComEC/Rec2 family competence protein, partial [Pseudomonadota bacterium]
MAEGSSVVGALRSAFSRERDRAALWAPVAIGLGVLAFFRAAHEPGLAAAVAATAILVVASGLWRWARRTGGPPLVALASAAAALGALGFGAAQIRAGAVAAPVLERAGAYAVVGRVIAVDADRLGRPRALLDQVGLDGVRAERTPARIRVRFDAAPAVGRRLSVGARLVPPPGPAEPGAFDFRRAAWFLRLGAVGAATGPPKDLGPASADGFLDGIGLAIGALRARLAAEARRQVTDAGFSADAAAVVAALLFGDRTGLSPEALAALRDANLSHLLAISGLHMGLVCLSVFGAARLAASLFPSFSARRNAKKIAALLGLVAGAGYLLLSGGALPTQRAFIMAAVAFGAILVDRPPITLRAVAAAAILILLLKPESVFDAGFQLSFAATTAMVAFFEATRRFWARSPQRLQESGSGALRAVLLWAAALVAASAVAGSATLPFAAAAFGRLAPYGLLANLLAVPTMGLWIMPLGLTALALTPFGLAEPVYGLMAVGVSYVLGVASLVASQPGSSLAAPTAPAGALALIAIGGLWLCLWRGVGLRAIGVAPILVGALLWRIEPRPDVLIAPEGRAVAVLVETPEGWRRAFAPRLRDRFAAQLWLRRDGDPALLGDGREGGEASALDRPAFSPFRGGAVARGPMRWRIEVLHWRRLDRRDAAKSCRGPTIVIAPNAVWSPDAAAPRAAGAASAGAASVGASAAEEAGRMSGGDLEGDLEGDLGGHLGGDGSVLTAWRPHDRDRAPCFLIDRAALSR